MHIELPLDSVFSSAALVSPALLIYGHSAIIILTLANSLWPTLYIYLSLPLFFCVFLAV